MAAGKDSLSISYLMVLVLLAALMVASSRHFTGYRGIIINIALTIAAIWIYIPARLHAQNRQSVDRTYHAYTGPDDPGKFDPILERFRREEAALMPLGFVRRGFFRQEGGMMPNLGAYLGIYENRTSNDVAKLIIVVTPKKRVETLGFFTRFVDGTEVRSSNSQAGLLWPAKKEMGGVGFPDVREPGRLHALHRRRVDRKGAFTTRQLPPADADLVASIRESTDKEWAHMLDTGYFHLDEKARCYRLTWKGAFLSAWKQLWPAGPIRQALRRWRADRMIRDLEAG